LFNNKLTFLAYLITIKNFSLCQLLINFFYNKIHKSFIFSSFVLTVFNINYSGLPHGQEKSGKTKENDKSQVKMGVFEKSQEIFL